MRQAQALGYAEAGPANDIEGDDAAYKLAILASLAFHTHVHPDDIYREGITRLSARDFRYATELGYAIKLLAIARRDGNGVQARVYTRRLSRRTSCWRRSTACSTRCRWKPTWWAGCCSRDPAPGRSRRLRAVMADVLEAAKTIVNGGKASEWRYTADVTMSPMAELVSRYYIRVEVADRPGVLAGIAKAFGDNNVSIASVIQKETDEAAQTAELAIMTHGAREDSVQASIQQIEALDEVRQVGNSLRVED